MSKVYLCKYCKAGRLAVLCEGCSRPLKYDGKQAMNGCYYGQARCTKKEGDNFGCEKSKSIKQYPCSKCYIMIEYQTFEDKKLPPAVQKIFKYGYKNAKRTDVEKYLSSQTLEQYDHFHNDQTKQAKGGVYISDVE